MEKIFKLILIFILAFVLIECYSKKVENFSDGLEYKYKITSSANTIAKAVEEGQKATITIIRQDLSGNQTSGTSSTVYISTFEGTADEGDYEKIDIREITFGNEDTTKTIEISTKTDNIADDGEYFWVDLFKSKADLDDANYHAYTKIFIKDK